MGLGATRRTISPGVAFRRLGTAVAMCGLLAAPAAAQVNIEDLRPEEAPEGRSGSVRGDVDFQTGNVSFLRLGLEARVNQVDDGVHTLVVGDGGLGFLGSSRFSSSGLLHLRRTYWVTDAVAPEWFLQTNYDRSRLLAFRLLAGGGIRSPRYRPDWGSIGGGTSLMVEHERFMLDDTASHPREVTVLRSSSFLTFQGEVGEGLVLSSTTYVQPRITDPGDIRILENLSAETDVTDRVALAISFDLRYDSRPPDETSSLDTRLRTGLILRY